MGAFTRGVENRTKYHCNRLPFAGVLTLVDVASDASPSGAMGHRVILTRKAAKRALPTLLGMAVDYKAGWDGHDARQKCGVIERAWLDGCALWVAGYLFGKDFPEVVEHISGQDEMGMSYELHETQVADMRRQIWTLTRTTFTGAAILLREKAAYRGTSFRLADQAEELSLAAAAEHINLCAVEE